ncbi:MAG: hypothetical protein IIC36_15115 [Gemmatimonadetes bacterium]|nr:hypothetical protein [Gemmatimonadota bacterium]
MKKPSWSVLLLIGVASAPTPTPAQDLRTLTIDDMFAIQRVGDPQISPDGEWYERYLAWYDRYVRGVDAATSDSGTQR